MLFLDILRSNQNAQVIIDALGNQNGVYIKGFIMEDFQFGGKNSFNSAMEALLGGINQVNSDVRTGTAMANRLGGGNVGARTISGGDSVSTWVASDRPRFSIPLLFLALNDGDDPRAILRDLMNFVYPGGDPNTILTAPMGYTANYVLSGVNAGIGCCSVSIGTYFSTPRLFIVKNLMTTISQRTDQLGVPLYVGAVIEFESMRTVTLDEVRSFFPGGDFSATDATNLLTQFV